MARPTVTLTVLRREQLTPHLIRVHFAAPGFTPNAFTDAYVKFIFHGEDGDEVRRTYTVAAADADSGQIAVDFVYHGDEGVAGPWAAQVEAGDTININGPNGAYAPNPAADWHLLAGDEAALPAVAAAIAALPADAVGSAFLEVAGPAEELPLTTPADVTLTWLHRGAAAPGETLAKAVRAADWLPGQPHVFIHGEAQSVMHDLRGYIRKERGVDAAWASISGYWRCGRTEESFRQWKTELAAAEQGS